MIPLNSYIQKIEESLRQGLIFESFNLATKLFNYASANKRVVQLYSLILAKLGDTEKARAYLEKIYKQGEKDIETSGILGRIYKDLWKKTGNTQFALFSRDL